MCLDTAWRLIENGCATSVTVASPEANRSTMVIRVGSASAANTVRNLSAAASLSFLWLSTIKLNTRSMGGVVNVLVEYKLCPRRGDGSVEQRRPGRSCPTQPLPVEHGVRAVWCQTNRLTKARAVDSP